MTRRAIDKRSKWVLVGEGLFQKRASKVTEYWPYLTFILARAFNLRCFDIEVECY
jgi:hypothetical protein